MRCLVVIDDVAERDAVAEAAAAFPNVKVDAVDVEAGRLLLRRRRFDFGVVTLRSDAPESEALWKEIRAVAPKLHVVGLTPASGLSVRRADKSRLNLFALLGSPLDVVELYSTLRRVTNRILKGRRSPAGDRNG